MTLAGNLVQTRNKTTNKTFIVLTLQRKKTKTHYIFIDGNSFLMHIWCVLLWGNVHC